jgi:hypothetical protein
LSAARIGYSAAAQLNAGPATGQFWDGDGLLLITVAHFGLLLVVIRCADNPSGEHRTGLDIRPESGVGTCQASHPALGEHAES